MSAEDPILRAFAPLIGLPAWGVKKGQGSMLTFEFGEPHLSVREPIVATASASPEMRERLARRRVVPSGAWYFWIYCCNWRLSVAGEQRAWSEDTHAVIHNSAEILDGQKLLGVETDLGKATARFSFDLGACLETWPYQDDESDGEQRLLYTPQDRVLTYYADGHHDWKRGEDV